MIALWMIYAAIVALMLSVAAAFVDRITRGALQQRRWIWVCALTLSGLVPAASEVAPRIGLGRAETSVEQARGRTGGSVLPSSGALNGLANLVARAEPQSLGRLDRLLAVIWASTALLAVAGYGIATWTLRLRQRSWLATQLDGQAVLLAPATGPAVIGAIRPSIVVPEWSLELTAEQRALMLAHERQHVAARDPLVLHAAAVVAMLMPWNVAIWWLHRRLRLAVELDCDARVLATARDPRAYGNLLLDVCARHLPSGAVFAPALFERTSSLTRRIVAMNADRPRFARTRLALGVATALAFAVIACDVPSPEALAPNGKNQPAKRLYGELSSQLQTGLDKRNAETHAMVARYFPSVARGEGGPAILFIVKSATGNIVMTDSKPWTSPVRTPAGSVEKIAAADRASSEQAMVKQSYERVTLREQPLRVSGPALPSVKERKSVFFKVPAGNAGWVPNGVNALRPDDINSIDVTKHAPGALAPNAISVITITLKPGALVPTPSGP